MGIKTKLNPLGGKGIVPYESSFQFTVRQARTSTPTTIYFSQQYDTIDYDVLIDWGDGAQTIIPAGVDWTSSIYRPAHDYGNTTEEYTISISSSKNIIPVFSRSSEYAYCMVDTTAYVRHILTPLLKFDWYNFTDIYDRYRVRYLFSIARTSYNCLLTICDNVFINNSELKVLDYLVSAQQDLQNTYINLINQLYQVYNGSGLSLDYAFGQLPSTATMTQENFEEYTSKYYSIRGSLDYAYYGFLFSSFPFNFVDYPNVTSFSYTFTGCSNLTTIPEGLFQYNTAVMSFSDTFTGCSNLTTIPEGLFQYNTAVTKFSGTFYDCSNLTTIPEGLFQYNTAVTEFFRTFDYCSNLTTIPEGLFQYNTAVTGFSSTFYDCSNLTTIPEGLFQYNTAVTSFSYTFRRCSKLTTIPEGLFQYNTAVTYFYSTFSDCSNLITIPEGLFQYNTAVTDFTYTFSYCYNLTTIPEGLFQYNTAVKSFSDTFKDCTSLTTIPEGLFQYNTAVINFSKAFSGCDSLVLNSNIFCNEATDIHTRFLDALSEGSTVSFNNTFRCSSNNSITGTAPRLWKYTYLRTPNSDGCFNNCTGLSNWNYIPTNWGGPYSWVVIKSYPEATVEFITDSETEIENPDEPYGIGVVEDSSVTYTVSKTGFNTITNTVTATGYDVYEVNLEPTNKTLIQQYTYLSTVPETLVDGNNFIINEDLLAITSGPSSYHIDNSASYGYLQITVPENSFYYVEINAYVSSWASIYNSSLSNLRGSIGGAVITSEPYQPNMKEAMFKLPREGFIFNEYGNNTLKLYTRTLSAGTHYLNFFYVKQNSSNRNEDRLIIDSINIYQADL